MKKVSPIKKMRQQKGWTQAQLSQEIKAQYDFDVSVRTIQRMESRHQSVTYSKFAATLGVLMGWEKKEVDDNFIQIIADFKLSRQK